MPRPVSQENIDKAITALSDNPDITGKQFQELSGLSRATAYQALRVARDQSASDHSETGDNGNGSKGDKPVISDNLSSETGDHSDQRVISKPGNQDTRVIEVDSVITDSSDSGFRVNQGAQLLKEPDPPIYGGKPIAQFKVDTAKKLLADNPAITGKQVAEHLNCCENTGNLALKTAKYQVTQGSREWRDRAQRLQETKIKKAIEATEMQVEDRLRVMRATATRLHREAELSGSTKDLEAAMRAWRQLTEYERQVTGIAQAERQATAATGKTELTLQLPITPDQLDQIKPV